MSVLFKVGDFGGDSRGWAAAIHELHNELDAMKASLRASHERESAWQRRCALLEKQLARRR